MCGVRPPCGSGAAGLRPRWGARTAQRRDCTQTLWEEIPPTSFILLIGRRSCGDKYSIDDSRSAQVLGCCCWQTSQSRCRWSRPTSHARPRIAKPDVRECGCSSSHTRVRPTSHTPRPRALTVHRHLSCSSYHCRINHLSHSDTCEISHAHAAIFLGNIWSDRSPWPRQPLPPWPQLQTAPSAVMARLWA